MHIHMATIILISVIIVHFVYPSFLPSDFVYILILTSGAAPAFFQHAFCMGLSYTSTMLAITGLSIHNPKRIKKQH